MGGGLLAGRSTDARRGLLFQHQRTAIDERIYWLLFQLYNTYHGWLRRHHARFKGCALACGNGSNDGVALRSSPDCAPGLALFQSKVARFINPPLGTNLGSKWPREACRGVSAVYPDSVSGCRACSEHLHAERKWQHLPAFTAREARLPASHRNLSDRLTNFGLQKVVRNGRAESYQVPLGRARFGVSMLMR